jgi:histidinol dehydrogenase
MVMWKGRGGMRVLDYSKAADKRQVERLLRHEPLEILKGPGTRADLTRRVFGKALTPQQAVDRIVEDVKTKGDKALFDYTRKLDGFSVNARNVRVSPSEIKAALKRLDPGVRKALLTAIRNVRVFHMKEKPSRWFHETEKVAIGQRWIPVEKAGLYVPGGLAAYPSSVVMNVIPAKEAGVRRVVVVTPVKKDGRVPDAVVAAAHLAGADEILKVGGAQAVAALAYGTASVPKVDKIVGPGNLFVALAKRKVLSEVGTDGFPGPSEVMILADGSVAASWAAADLLAQAEHDEMATPILVTTSASYAKEVAREVEIQIEKLKRRDIARDSVLSRGAVVKVAGRNQMIELANRFAPEHLEILCRNPRTWLPFLRNAGAIFLGPFSAEAFGDYTAGPNHVLPTSGTARYASGLSVYDFLKRTNVLEVKAVGVRALGRDTVALAEAEGLTGHAQSVVFRMRGVGVTDNP